MNSFHATKFGKGKKKGHNYFAVLEVTEAYPIQHAKDAGKTHTRLYDNVPDKNGKAKDTLPVMVGSISEPEPTKREYRQRTVNNPNNKGWQF